MQSRTHASTEGFIELVASVRKIGAVAFGGSSATDTMDAASDLDLFTFCLDEDLPEVVRTTIECLRRSHPSHLVHGPMLSHRFGIKIFAIGENGFWADLFFNSPLTFSPLPMTAKMRFLNPAHQSFLQQHFPTYQADAPASRTAILQDAWIEAIDALKGMAKSVGRGVDTGFQFYRGRFATLYFALRLQELNILDFDPHRVERRFRTIVQEHPQAAILESELPEPMTLESVQICHQKLQALVSRSPFGRDVLDRYRRAGTVLDSLMSRTTSLK